MVAPGRHFVASFLHFCCRWRKNRLRLLVDTPRQAKAEDLLEVEPLVSRELVMVLRPVWASRLGEALAKTEDLSKPEWLFMRF